MPPFVTDRPPQMEPRARLLAENADRSHKGLPSLRFAFGTVVPGSSGEQCQGTRAACAATRSTEAGRGYYRLLHGSSSPFEDENEKGYTFTATGTHRRLGVPVVESVNVGGGPNGIRTRVSALRGPCPGPLDDGAAQAQRHEQKA